MTRTASQTISVGPLSVRFVLDVETSGGNATAFECEVPTNTVMAAAHSHDGFEETVYGLSGRTTFTVAGETIEIGPGDSICIPRGVVHGFVNGGSEEARFLAIISPGLFGPAYFREINEVLAASAGGPPDLAAMGEVMRAHGLTPA